MIVQDGGAPPRSATGTVYVTVLDENDNAPSFLHVASGQELPVQVGQQREPGEAGLLWLLGSGLLGAEEWAGAPRRVPGRRKTGTGCIQQQPGQSGKLS